MPAFCSCASTLANTGAPNSQKIIAIGVKLIAVNLFADDGTQNHIANTDTIDQTYLDGKLNETDKTKRWYPIGTFVNVTETREDPNYEEFTDGSRGITRLGRRTYNGKLLSYYSRYLAKLETFACQRFGFFTVDDCGNLVGRVSADGTKLYPVSVNQDSWYATLEKSNFETTGGLMVSFDFLQTMKDKDLRTIEASEMSVDLLDAEGLRDVTTVVSNITTTGFRATMTLSFDEFLSNPLPAISWVLADFDLYNVTDSASITITSVTETDPGVSGIYDFVIPAQDSADVLRLRSSKNGFDMGDVSITIP